MKVEAMGMLWMMPAGWRNSLLRVPWRALEPLPEGRLIDGMNEFTLLGASARGVQGCADSIKAELRVTLVAGEGSTPGWAAAFRMGAMGKQFVSEQWILSCKSLGRSLVYHL